MQSKISTKHLWALLSHKNLQTAELNLKSFKLPKSSLQLFLISLPGLWNKVEPIITIVNKRLCATETAIKTWAAKAVQFSLFFWAQIFEKKNCGALHRFLDWYAQKLKPKEHFRGPSSLAGPGHDPSRPDFYSHSINWELRQTKVKSLLDWVPGFRYLSHQHQF